MGFPIGHIAQTLHVGETFVKKVLSIYKATSGVEYEKHRKGRKRIITGLYCLQIFDFFNLCNFII